MTTEDVHTLALLPIITWDPDTEQLLFDLAKPLGEHLRVGITLSVAEDVVTHGLEAQHIGSGTDFYGQRGPFQFHTFLACELTLIFRYGKEIRAHRIEKRWLADALPLLAQALARIKESHALPFRLPVEPPKKPSVRSLAAVIPTNGAHAAGS